MWPKIHKPDNLIFTRFAPASSRKITPLRGSRAFSEKKRVEELFPFLDGIASRASGAAAGCMGRKKVENYAGADFNART
jgi:hypothetical protein